MSPEDLLYFCVSAKVDLQASEHPKQRVVINDKRKESIHNQHQAHEPWQVY